MIRIVALLFLVFISSCNKNKIPAGILPPEKMETIMWDLIQADEFVKAYIVPYDSLANDTTESIKLYKKVFQLNKITREEYNKSFEYYKSHNSLMKQVLDSLNVRAQKAPTDIYQPVAIDDSITVIKPDTSILPERIIKKPKRFD